jgi:hypothetical protein
MRTRRLLALTAPTAFAASTAFTKLGRESRRENESVYPPPHAVRGRGTARERGGGGMLSSGFFSDKGARPHRRGPLPARSARDLPRSAGEDDSRWNFHFVIAGLDPAIHADAPLARQSTQ